MSADGTKPYRILIADDHSVVRRGIRALLASQAGLEICSEASTGIETLEAVRKHNPNLVILDLTMPEMNGLDVARTIREEHPETRVMVLSMHFTDGLARDVIAAGASAYVLKSDADKELVTAVEHVRHGKPFFTARLTTSMLQSFMDNPGVPAEPPDPGLGLTPREIEIVQLLVRGSANKQVAAALNVSTRTIESHRHHIMRKLGLTSFSDLVLFAVRNGLVDV